MRLPLAAAFTAGLVLGGYVAEVVGAAVTSYALKSTQAPGEGSAYAFVAGLVIGPLVANTLYSLWAASDVYFLAQAKQQP